MSNRSPFTLYVMITKGEGGDYGALNAESYGLEKLFNQYYHHGKSYYEEKEITIDVNEYNFPNKKSADVAIDMIEYICSACQDYDSSKHTTYHLFTKDNIWDVCELSDDEEKTIGNFLSEFAGTTIYYKIMTTKEINPESTIDVIQRHYIDEFYQLHLSISGYEIVKRGKFYYMKLELEFDEEAARDDYENAAWECNSYENLGIEELIWIFGIKTIKIPPSFKDYIITSTGDDIEVKFRFRKIEFKSPFPEWMKAYIDLPSVPT